MSDTLRSTLISLWRRWCQPTHRVLLSTVGAYCVASTFAAALGLILSATFGAPKAAMLIWSILLGFIVYFIASVWSFSDPHGWRIWLVFSLICGICVSLIALLGGDPSLGFGG